MHSQRGARILLVEDMAAVRLTLGALLGRRGYEVVAAESGEEAVALLEREVFDLLLLDVHLPGMSGPDVAHYAEQLGCTAGIMFLTGSAYVERGAEMARLEGFPCLSKTASPQEVLDTIALVLSGVRR